MGFMVSGCNHILFEECYAYGTFRYAFYSAGSAEKIIFRRCVARIDASNTTTGISAFTVYDAKETEIQNATTYKELDAILQEIEEYEGQ